ncbi:MAG: hypothetical protein AAF576_01425 [Pseudomonadota bacterium]
MIAALVPIGLVLTSAGLVLLGWFIFAVARAKSAGLSEDEVKARLQKLVAVNLGAVALAGLGLMCLVMGLMLG